MHIDHDLLSLGLVDSSYHLDTIRQIKFNISKLILKLSENEINNTNIEIKDLKNTITEMNDKIKSFSEYDFIDSSDIQLYRDTIDNSKTKIEELEEYLKNGYYGEFESNKLQSNSFFNNGIVSGGLIWTSNSNYQYSNYYFDSYLDKQYVKVTFLDKKLNDETVNVYDDIFKSELGNYYLQTTDNNILYLKNVIKISEYNNDDEDSKLHKWYYEKISSHIRSQKLKKLL